MASDSGRRRTQGIRPVEPVTRDRIAAVAMRVLNQRGVAGLSMPAVAKELGVTKGAVAWHVGDRQGLLDLVVSSWLCTVEPPADEAGWAAWIVAFAHAYREAAFRQPNVARLVAPGLSINTDPLSIPKALVERLEHSGLPADQLVHAYNAVLVVTIGFVELELGPSTTRTSVGWTADERLPAITRHIDMLAGSAFALRQDDQPVRLDESFAYVIDLLVAGLASRFGRPVRPADS